MTRHILRLLVTGALLFPAALYALGLGEIHLNSALSQPFDAEIELLSPSQDELNSLKVGLASPESFARSGIDRASYLSNFTFKVVPTGDGRAVVRVTSTRAITEPVVSLLLEASWARGRWVREYTVFLDPPVFVPVQPAPQVDNRNVTPPPIEAPRNEGAIERAPPSETMPPETSAPEQAVVPPPVTTAPTPSVVEPEPASPIPTPPSTFAPSPTVAADNYDVQRNDSLWRIASRLRPGDAKSINQTMIALYRANPSAFAGNMNRLRSGAVLRIPAADEIEAIDTRTANAEVTRQLNEWRPPSTAVIEEPPPPAETDRGHLRLVTPTEPAAPVDTAASKAAEKAKEAEEAKAEAAQRESDRVAAETKQRADAEAAKRLLDLKNAELARAQQAAAAAAEAKAKAEAAAKVEAQAQAQADAAAKAAQVKPEPATATPPAETPPVETKAEAPAPQPAAAKPAPATQSSDTLGDLPWMYILAGLLLVMLLAGWIWNSRRKPEDRHIHFPMPEASVPTMTQADFDAAISDEPAPAPVRRQSYTKPAAEAVESFDESLDIGGAGPESFDTAEGTKPLHDGGAPAELPKSGGRLIDETMSSETAVHVDQQDAVAEADFHMAYGLYDQAADLVKIALSREPKRRDLKLKLLEIYFVWGNKDLFIETAKDLFTTRDQAPAGEWDKIVIMGKQIAPQDPLFQGTSVSAAGDLLDVNLEGGENRVDFDLFSTPETESGNSKLDFEVGNTGSRQKPSHLDFLLDDSGSAPVADDDTREMDPNARTQETPTIESPMLDRRTDERVRESTMDMTFGSDLPPADQTAELSIDDLGLDVNSLESTGSLEHTAALTNGTGKADESIGDDELTRIAPASAAMAAKLRQASMEPTAEVPRLAESRPASRAPAKEVEDHDGSGTDVGVSTIYLEQLESASGELVDSMGPRSDETAHMLAPEDLDIDLGKFGETDASDDDATHHRAARPAADTGATAEHVRPKIEQSDVLVASAHPEMEPVTMSEVGTKLDLARAYMDMGDPDGARSILEEVLGEGNSGQRAEAQRLLDSIR